MKRGFSLLEVVIVCIIIGILASFAFPGFIKMREGAMDKEAMASLRLIQAAEDSYYLETTEYFITTTTPCQQATSLNTNLALRLNTVNWDYCIAANGTTDYFALAWRQKPNSGGSSLHRSLRISRGDTEACCKENCSDSNTNGC